MDRLQGAVSAASGAVSAATNATTNAAATVYGATPDAVKDLAEDAKRRAEQAATTVMDLGAQKMDEYRKLVEMFIKRKVHTYIGKVMDMIPGVVKENTDDPDMPGMVKRGKDRFIDAAWPDIREEIMWEVAVQLDGQKHRPEDELGPGPDCIRGFLRYHIYPYDKNFWGHLRDPVWVIFTLVSLIPWAGMCPIVFFFIFLIIDKTDEFQLLQFILQFKGTQFISMGIIKSIIGFFMFVNCVTAGAKEGDHTCEESGPGISAFYVIFGGWILQVILIWIAFFLLPCAKDKGRTTLGSNIDYEHSGAGGKNGGYIRYLMIWDIIMFLFCMAIIGYVVTTVPDTKLDYWVVMHTVFACQVIYGFSATPFFFFTLPFLQAILTHCVPTAYDKLGRCRKIKGPPHPPKKTRQMPTFISMEDAKQLTDKAKQIFTEGKSASSLFATWKEEDVVMTTTDAVTIDVKDK